MQRLTVSKPLMTSKSEETTLIVGAGIAGLTAALAMTLATPSRRIVVVESSARAGGSFSSLEVANGCYFDRGVHLIPSPSEPLFEAFFTPENGFDADYWNALRFPRNDRSGIFINGSYNLDSSLVNVGAFDRATATAIRAEFDALTSRAPSDCSSVGDYIRCNFGDTMCALLAPIIQAKFGRPAEDLSPTILNFYPIKRLVVAGPEETEALSHDPRYAPRIGYPRQEDLPLSRSSNPVNFYPKIAGIGTYIDRIIAFLCKRGVEIIFESEVTALAAGPEEATHDVFIRRKSGEEVKFAAAQVLWSSPAVFLNRLLSEAGVVLQHNASGGRPEQVVEFVHFCTAEPIIGTEVFYFYPFTPDQAFRCTNYAAFTEHLFANAYTLEVMRSAKSTCFSADEARLAVASFLSSTCREESRVTRLYTDPFRVSVPTTNVAVAPSPDAGEGYKTVIPGIFLFGSTATGRYMISKEIFSAAAKFVETL